MYSLFGGAPILCGGLVLEPCIFCNTLCHFQLWNHLAWDERASCFTLVVF